MFKWFSRIRDWLFGEHEEPIAQVTQNTILATLEPEPIAETIGERATAGLNNAANIQDILDNLPGYFADLRALRDFDEDAYALFATLGGCMTNESSLFATRIDPSTLENPPAICCYFSPKSLQGSYKDERIAPAIVFMMRLQGGHVSVQRDGAIVSLPEGICYRVAEVFNSPDSPYPVAFDYYVHITGQGDVKVLRETRTIMQSVPPAWDAGSRRISRGSFPRVVTTIPEMVRSCAKEKGLDPDAWASTLIPIVISAQRPKDAILVRAKRGTMVASWTIDKRDAKRFFAKRSTGLASDGKRKRVLHYVGDFTRRVGESVQSVRAHYRGERSFDWEGNLIEISGLGFHHKDFFASNIAAFEDPKARPGRMISMKRVADEMRTYYTREHHLSQKRKAA